MRHIMPQSPKTKRHDCKYCLLPLVPKTRSGYAETDAQFFGRKFCDMKCMCADRQYISAKQNLEKLKKLRESVLKNGK